jgi:hypothetical protein
MKRGLKPDDVCVPFRAIANPDSHQAVQMTGAHATTSGQLRDTHAPVLTLDFAKRCRDGGVQGGTLEPMQQKSLKNLDAPFGSNRAKFFSDEVAK